MSDVDWTVVAAVFNDALELAPELRPAFVAKRTSGQPAVRAAVERMLRADASAHAAFPPPLDADLLLAAASAAEPMLERVGPWRILGEIGRGGMGQVLLGVRDDGQFDQTVAIKLLKRGMDSDAILARFHRERRILAGLDHPNVARLLDGGVAADGRPYFVMEHVDGLRITDFADERRLSLDERLTLFDSVCLAVEYAHRNLVIHRDLKPSNILVTADGRPKLLDFGIARLLSAEDDDDATATGVRLLTPEYAAPEQFDGRSVTTSTDVYGLGAVLYELLSGHQPFEARPEQHRLQREPDAEPVPLSSAVERTGRDGDDGPTTETLARARSTDPARLVRALAGDLDVIAATALRSSPERRYASVAALREDLQRHQRRRTVHARPDTLGYRASRFVRRNRAGVLTAGAIAALVLAFGVTAMLQAGALAKERDRAQGEAAAAGAVADFLVGVFEVADPMQPGHGDSLRATQLLDRGAVRIETDLAGQPVLQARMLGVIGRAYDNLLRSDLAEPLLARAVELQAAADGEGTATAAALQQLARARVRHGDYPGADSALARAMAIHRRLDPDGAGVWALLVDQAHLAHARGDYTAGRTAVADALALFRLLPAAELHGSQDALRLAELLGFSRDGTDVDSVFSRLLALESAATGAGSAPAAAALFGWSRSRAMRGDFATADSLLSRALTIHSALDPTSVLTAALLAERAGLLVRSNGDLVLADSLARAATRIYEARLGPDHRDLAVARQTLASSLHRRGLHDEAVAMNRLTVATFARDPNDRAVLLPNAEHQFANALHAAGQTAEAIATFASALAAFETHFPPDYLLAANLRRDYGAALVDAGRPADAIPLLHRAIAVLAARWGEQHFAADAPRISLGRAMAATGRAQEARDLLRDVYERVLAERGPDDRLTARARDALDALEPGAARR